MTNDEIDLSEHINEIWINKWKIILITFVTLAISLFLKLNSKTPEIIYIAKTPIVPISSFKDYQYKAYNTFIAMQENPGLNSYVLNNSDYVNNEDVSFTINFQNNGFSKNNYLRKIDKKYLFNLFIEKINQNKLFIEGIKKFNIIKREDYKNIEDYEAAAIKVSSLIKISKSPESEENRFIEFETVSKETWEELLYFVETSANSEIKDYLEKNFKLFILSEEELKKFHIEDIEFEIQNNLENELVVSKLKKIKKRKEENKMVERLEYLFANTPILNSEDFSASKFNVQLTQYKKKKNTGSYSTKKVIIFSIILGALLGIMYVLVVNKLIIRKK